MALKKPIYFVCGVLIFLILMGLVTPIKAQENSPVRPVPATSNTFKNLIPDTGQDKCYNNSREIRCPKPGSSFYGQDAQYAGAPPRYLFNGNGTITDPVTGLMWSTAVDSRKLDLIEAQNIARKMTLAGHTDWRIPNIKELYSLIDFRGYTGFDRGGFDGNVPPNAIPYINTDFFDFRYGNTRAGERYIDAQWLSSTKYVSTTMDGAETLFGVNFADGRIKGYGYKKNGRVRKKFYARYVRGNAYGANVFVDNKDGTISDNATGLMWMKKDGGKPMKWKEALNYAENLVYAGFDDWRLPNAKELQYIVDYTRSPDTTKSSAIDPLFQTTSIKNEAGQMDYPHFWTSTTHLDGPIPASNAAYVAFGRAMGQMRGRIMDVHGAGAQRSDPKTGWADIGHGPQGDARRVSNFVRCVRGGSVMALNKMPAGDRKRYPQNLKIAQSLGGDTHGGPMQMPQQRPGRGGFVAGLDKDGDGKVSRSEFDGPKDRFRHHDRNNDGYITEDEAPQGPPPQRQ